MTAIVVDASVALAWCFPDEASEYADAVLTGLAGYEVWVPAVWPLEVANAIAVGERRKRITQPEIRRFLELLEALTVQQDSLPLSASVSNILPLAQAYGLSAYDAAYLEVAIRRGALLTTLDTRLEKAARKAGVEIFTVNRPKPKKYRTE